MKYLSVKNFERFQHYRDRAPPWIKLYNAILDDYEFCALPDASRYHLLAIMLLASRSDNRIPADSTWIAGRIGARGKVDLDVLIASGFLRVISDATDDVAGRKHDASKLLEREEREERREEREPEKRQTAASASVDVFEGGFWKAYPRKTGKADALKAWRAATKGTPPETILAGLAAYRWPADPQFIPYPATWLRGGRWADEPTPENQIGVMNGNRRSRAAAQSPEDRDRARRAEIFAGAYGDVAGSGRADQPGDSGPDPADPAELARVIGAGRA